MAYHEQHAIPAQFLPLLPEGVTVKLFISPEDSSVRGNAMDSGDDENDKAIEDEIIKRLESSLWAWCVVTVEVTDGDASGMDTLGQCSYWSDDETDAGATLSFCEGGYLPQMIESALDEYKQEAARLAAKYSRNL